MSDQGQEDQLLSAIKRAFIDVPSPMGNITNHFCPECEKLAASFEDKDWRDFLSQPCELFGSFYEPKDDLFISRDCFSLLTIDAIHYFLPAFLALMIREEYESDVMLDLFPGQFDPGPKAGKEDKLWQLRYDRSKDLIARMNPGQREAVRAAIQFIYREEEASSILPTQEDALENLLAGDVVAWKRH